MFRRIGSTVAVCVALIASGVLLGQALSGGEAADAQRREAGEILGRATPGAVVKELQQTSEICLLLAAQTRPPQCF